MVVYGISQSSFKHKSDAISKNYGGKGRPPIVEFIEPLSDENSRLVSQGGLFSRAPSGVDLEKWVREHYSGEKEKIRMWKILIPFSGREEAMRSLNRMNINHASLFPDIYGASKFVNTGLDISNY